MIRDPFNIHRKSAFQATAVRAAHNIKDAAAQAGAAAFDMSFSLPKNVPDFAAPQRHLEDRAWTAVTSRVAGLLDQPALPMYKDKPYSYVPSMRRRPWWRRKRVLGALLLGTLALLHLAGLLRGSAGEQRPPSVWSWMGLSQDGGGADWDERRRHVVEAFELSWDAYERYAWGTSRLPAGHAARTLTGGSPRRVRRIPPAGQDGP